MGKTSAKVKNEWNRKNYDRIEIFVPKGKKAMIKVHAEKRGFTALNAYINHLIEEDMKKDIMSSEEALKDIEPFDWSEDVLSGKTKVTVNLANEDMKKEP